MASTLGACSPDVETTETPPSIASYDLYIYPPSNSEGISPFVAQEVFLSWDSEDPTIVSGQEGGQSLLRILSPPNEAEGIEDPQPLRARVTATDENERIFVGVVEAGSGRNEYSLRTPAGLYDIVVEPYDTSLAPLYFEDVSLPLSSEWTIELPENLQVLGLVLEDSDTLEPLTSVEIYARFLGQAARASSIAKTDADGAFTLSAPEGQFELWAQRDGTAQGEADTDLSPIASTSLGTIIVSEDAPSPSYTLGLETTTELVGEVYYNVDQRLSDVKITATRLGDGKNGELTVWTTTGSRSNLGTGVFSLSLPSGDYSLDIEPPLTTYDTLAPLEYPNGELISLPESGQLPSISVTDVLLNLSGELSLDDSPAPAIGTSLLFFPQSSLQSTLSTQAGGEQATFDVSIRPPGVPPLALAVGTHTVLMIPPLGYKTARQQASFSVVSGQSELSLPDMQSGLAVYGRLELDGSSEDIYQNAVIKAVLPGDTSYAEKWGPGPDPTAVVAEAIVDASGNFTLYLPQ